MRSSPRVVGTTHAVGSFAGLDCSSARAESKRPRYASRVACNCTSSPTVSIAKRVAAAGDGAQPRESNVDVARERRAAVRAFLHVDRTIDVQQFRFGELGRVAVERARCVSRDVREGARLASAIRIDAEFGEHASRPNEIESARAGEFGGEVRDGVVEPSGLSERVRALQARVERTRVRLRHG